MRSVNPRSTVRAMCIRACLISTVFSFAVMLIASTAQAIPAFARAEGQECNYCHIAYPKLNSNGMYYKANGYRFPGAKPTNIWDDASGIPLSMVAEIEGAYDHTKRPSGGLNSKKGLRGGIDEVELLGAGTVTSRLSYFVELEIAADNNNVPEFAMTWVQLNDLVGDEGQLNFRVGNNRVDLPFLSHSRRVLRNRYLAQDNLGLLNQEFGIELNGQCGADQDSGKAHRYAVGLVENNDSGSSSASNFKMAYGWYSYSFNKTTHAGVEIMGGKNYDNTTTRQDYTKLAIAAAAETQIGNVTLTAGYFFDYANRDRTNPLLDTKKHDIMGEAIFQPNDSWVLGARLDWLKETVRNYGNGQNWGLRTTLLARYNVVQNVWLGGEYRIDVSDYNTTGNTAPLGNFQHEQKIRLFATLAF